MTKDEALRLAIDQLRMAALRDGDVASSLPHGSLAQRVLQSMVLEHERVAVRCAEGAAQPPGQSITSFDQQWHDLGAALARVGQDMVRASEMMVQGAASVVRPTDILIVRRGVVNPKLWVADAGDGRKGNGATPEEAVADFRRNWS